MSIRPKALLVSSTRCRSSSLDEMLAGIGFAASRPHARLMAAAVSAQASALRDEMMTVAPCSASRSAMARPMPREEPVTIATRPVRSNRLVKISSRWAARRVDDCIVRRVDARGEVRTLLVAATRRGQRRQGGTETPPLIAPSVDRQALKFDGGRTRARTLDPLIKSLTAPCC